MSHNNKYQVAIIGGGITGLSAAFYLQKQIETMRLPVSFTLLEATDHLGGKIRTFHRDGFVIEGGPDSWLERKGDATQLAIDLGLEKELVNNAVGQSYIVQNDQLYPIPPESVMGIPTSRESVFDSPLVSMEGKKRAWEERNLPPRLLNEDQSVGRFLRDRFGEEWVDRVMEPLISGVYGNNIDDLSLRSTFPQFEELLFKHGSLISAMQKTRVRSAETKSSTGVFQTLQNGLESLVHRIEEALPTGVIQKNAELQQIEPHEDGYLLKLVDGRSLTASAVIFTTPHPVTERVLAPYVTIPTLNQIQPTSVAILVLAFSEGDIEIPLEGTGFLIPRTEGYRITASTWVHKKWPHTTPDNKVLLRCFIGRPDEQSLVEKREEEILQIGLEDLRRIKAIRVNREPEFYHVEKLFQARPMYQVGHKEWWKQTQEKVQSNLPNIYLAGSFYDGVGIPDCIRQGKEAVERVAKQLDSMMV